MKVKTRINLNYTLYPIVIFKLKFTLSSEYDIIIRWKERMRRKERKKYIKLLSSKKKKKINISGNLIHRI
jgi:hypothetical protein